jgi:hypothetical protein
MMAEHLNAAAPPASSTSVLEKWERTEAAVAAAHELRSDAEHPATLNAAIVAGPLNSLINETLNP